MDKVCYSHPLNKVSGICNNSHNEILFRINQDTKNRSTLSLPGCFVRHGELIEEALRRSIFDQTALCVEPIEILGIYSKIESQSRLHTIESVFVCIVTNLPERGSKINPAQYVWIGRDQIEGIEKNICNIKILNDYFSWRTQKSTFWSTKI